MTTTAGVKSKKDRREHHAGNADKGAKHSKDCLQMDECAKSGYGVLTDDKKIIMFRSSRQ